MGKGFYSFMHFLDSLIHAARQPSSTGIQMSSSIEELSRKVIAWEIINATQTYLYNTSAFCILTQEHA